MALNEAGKTKQTANRNHDAASALFLKNPADPPAVDGLSKAIDRMAAAGEGWKTAEQVAAGSQKVLTFAQFRLDTQNQQAMGTLMDEVKREIEQKLKDATEQSIRTGEIPLNVSTFMDGAQNEPFTLAQGNESGIIREDGKPLGTGVVATLPKDSDVEVYWKDIQPKQVATTSPIQASSTTPTPTPPPNRAGDTVNAIPTPTSGVGPIPITTPDPSSYQEPNFYTQETPEPQKNTIKGAGYTDDPNKVYQQWAEQYFKKYGIMPKIILPSAAAEGWSPRIEKIRYETKTVKTYSATDVVKEVWGMIGEGTKLVGNAAGIAAQVFTGAPADKVSEVVDGAVSILTKPQFFEGGAKFLDKVYNTGGTFENIVDGVDQFFDDHTGDSYVQHTLTIKWAGIPTPQNGVYTYNVYEGQKVDKDVVAGFENTLFFGTERGW